MTPSLFFRAATATDTPTIAQHSRSAALEAQQYRGTLSDSAPQGEEMCFVAGIGETVLGSVIVDRQTNGVAHIRRVYVDSAAREVGLGDTLVSGVLQWLLDAGYTWVSGTALPGDRQTKNLFERHGLVAQSITVGRRLSGPSTEEHASQ